MPSTPLVKLHHTNTTVSCLFQFHTQPVNNECLLVEETDRTHISKVVKGTKQRHVRLSSVRWNHALISKVTANICITARVHIISETFFLEITHSCISCCSPSSALSAKSCGLSLLLREQKQVCCFRLQEVYFEMKEMTQCEINCEQVLGCIETAPPQHHLRITEGRKMCSCWWACTVHTDIFLCALTRKPKTMESDQVNWLLLACFHHPYPFYDLLLNSFCH